ncbi:benzoate/H(+) symporter BenE family transporter [Phreatobacter stygius]|uniref:Benzoate/H(+) symporter BenE family transporter n=2 Tax=Phreatobacter stygius TaxID=1940610 RepID=A0A4D7BDV7_9HYPH|nr:benzoate/H(+) symporter BenE family transporter [Phreatobacter stygius]
MPPFSLSTFTAGIIAPLVGFAGTVAIVIAAAQAVGATPGQTISWLAAISLAQAISGMALTWRYKMPIIIAWSTPGAALIAATGGTITMPAAVGAFMLVAVLIIATGLVRPIGDLVARIPPGIASAMLAGVLFKFVADVVLAAPGAPLLVLPLVVIFLVARLVHPASAMLVVVAMGVGLTYALGLAGPLPGDLGLARLEWVTPSFEAGALIGLGLPLYLVTMAAQNLPGLAVLRANGYNPPVGPVLTVTGIASLVSAPFGAHTSNLAAITAAICAGPDAHPDRAKRWPAGIVYGLAFILLAAFADPFVALFGAMPKALITTIAGLALAGALMGALSIAMGDDKTRFPAILSFATAASGVSVLGVGAAFWGLAIGLVALGVERLCHKIGIG